jgi:DNA-directed RNA polymerase specialized sigma24 family protein
VHGDDPSMTKTDWSMIHDAISDDPEVSAADAMDQIARRYWPAVYAYIRSTGRDTHEAADLTQGFMCDVVLGRRLLSMADPKRGRFRSLLQTALRNYLHERHRHATTQTRGGNMQAVALDSKVLASADAMATSSPDDAFVMQWSAMLVRRVVDRVRSACLGDGLEPHWQVFEARVVRPMLFGDPPVSYPDLVTRLELKDTAQAANMTVTVKRRFASALCLEVSRTVRDPDDVKAELGELMNALGAMHQAVVAHMPTGSPES